MTISGENITLTRHELNSIVEDAVLKALKKIVLLMNLIMVI